MSDAIPPHRQIVNPDPEAVVELGQLRRRELTTISDRLGRVDDRGHGHLWNSAAGILASVGLGALLAGIPLLSSTTKWDGWIKPVYGSTALVVFLVAALCTLAGRSVKRERADSVSDIKYDLDHLLNAYTRRSGLQAPPAPPVGNAELVLSPTPLPTIAPPSPDADDRSDMPFLQRMRAEALQHMRLISEVRERGKYWKLTEGPTPETKAWKNYSPFLEGEAALAEAYDAGGRAAAEVDAVMTARSLRLLRGSREVHPDDHLDKALTFLADFERLLGQAMERSGGDA